MRAPVLLESWWKRTVFGDVALYSLTGTLTNPKLIAPDQIARAIHALYSERAVRSSNERAFAGRSISRPSDVARLIHSDTAALPAAARHPRPRRSTVPGGHRGARARR